MYCQTCMYEALWVDDGCFLYYGGSLFCLTIAKNNYNTYCFRRNIYRTTDTTDTNENSTSATIRIRTGHGKPGKAWNL